MRVILLFLACLTITSAVKVNYKKYKVFRVVPKSKHDVAILNSLEKSNETYNFWKAPDNLHPADLMVAPEKLTEFLKLMNFTGMQYNEFIDDVQTLINLENSYKTSDSNFDWTSYHTLEEINSWLESLENDYPGVVTVIVGGHSYEGRDIKGIKISYKEANPGVFIEGGVHAREWISPATVTYLINEFLTSDDPAIRELAESHDWYIFPSINPDGYVYTHTTDRLWRKTRSKSDNGCYGADGNRNWDSMWMKIGTSKDKCSSLYGGSEPFSEIETKTLSEYVKSIGDKLFAYISFHSYSQLLLFPYGYTTEHLENYDETYAIGLKTIDALSERYGTKYTLGTFYEALYPGSGISIDWVKSTLKLPITYLFELRDQGKYGFLLPADQIVPNAQEITDALLALFSEAILIEKKKRS